MLEQQLQTILQHHSTYFSNRSNTATPGVYVLTYRVSDNAGNAATPGYTITVTDQVITLNHCCRRICLH
jgi:hypothetical protein